MILMEVLHELGVTNKGLS